MAMEADSEHAKRNTHGWLTRPRPTAGIGEMMRTIWKYCLSFEHSQEIAMPIVAEPLTVQMQDNNLVLWMRVVPELDKEPRRVLIVPTGGDAQETIGLRYVGTFQHRGFVGHVFVA